MAKIKVKQGAGDEPSELAKAICEGRKFPFMATITHKAAKPLLVPSTGINEVIAPGVETQFKVKNFEQAWVLVTDSAALAKRYSSDDEDFVVFEVPDVAKEEPAAEVPEEAPKVVETKPTGKGGKAAADAASE
jgi:hypothetical protein